jgi:hypothetical protein
MPMPSLLKYFAFVGTALLAVITLANFLLDPSTGATVVATQAKVIPAVQHDPRASKIERWRNEQAALKAAAQTQTAENASLVTKSELAPPRQQAVVTQSAEPVQAQPAQAQPVQAQPIQVQPNQTEPALQTADVSAEHDAAAARAAELAQAKAEKARAAKAAKAARTAKLARERARTDQLARDGGQNPSQYGQPQQGQWQQGQNQFYSGAQQRTASNQQDQFYYGQRTPAQQPGPGYAYAPRPNYGPFGGRW